MVGYLIRKTQIHDFHTKQQFYTEFVVHQIIFKNHLTTSQKGLSEDFQNKIKLGARQSKHTLRCANILS